MERPRICAALTALALLAAACGPQNREVEASDPAPAEVAAVPGATPISGPTLEAVRERGRVTCGVAEGLPGFSDREVLGWRGFDIDLCRAVAAAVFGDARRVRFLPFETRERLGALQAGEIDLIPRAEWNFARDAGLALDFVGVAYYDNQGFLAVRALAGRSVDDLAGRRVCVQSGTTEESNLVEHFAMLPEARRPELGGFDTAEGAFEAYRRGECEVLTGDRSNLSSQRTLLRDPDSSVLLDSVISKEPQGPVVRQDDPQWSDIVSWTLNAMILAEEFGLSTRNVSTERDSAEQAEVVRLLSADENYGRMLLLPEDWAFQVIRQVGNYGEVFDRNLGPNTPLAIERGQNQLWNAEKAGLIYAPPMR